MDPYFLLNIEWVDTHLFGQVSESMLEPFYCLECFPQHEHGNYYTGTYALSIDIADYGGMLYFRCMFVNAEYPIPKFAEWEGKLPFDLLTNAERSQLHYTLEGIEPNLITTRDRLQAILALD